MSRRRAALVALAVGLPAVGLLTWALVAKGTSTPGPPPKVLGPVATPRVRAVAACRVVAQVQGFVAKNVASDTVFSYLDVAKRELELAAAQEPIWISLQSGVVSIDRGLREDDPGASELGIAIARDQCRSAGVRLPGSVAPEPAAPGPSGSVPPRP